MPTIFELNHIESFYQEMTEDYQPEDDNETCPLTCALCSHFDAKVGVLYHSVTAGAFICQMAVLTTGQKTTPLAPCRAIARQPTGFDIGEDLLDLLG